MLKWYLDDGMLRLLAIYRVQQGEVGRDVDGCSTVAILRVWWSSLQGLQCDHLQPCKKFLLKT